jgi:hypothetical protein
MSLSESVAGDSIERVTRVCEDVMQARIKKQQREAEIESLWDDLDKQTTNKIFEQ